MEDGGGGGGQNECDIIWGVGWGLDLHYMTPQHHFYLPMYRYKMHLGGRGGGNRGALDPSPCLAQTLLLHWGSLSLDSIQVGHVPEPYACLHCSLYYVSIYIYIYITLSYGIVWGVIIPINSPGRH